jgi:hypothetical protein
MGYYGWIYFEVAQNELQRPVAHHRMQTIDRRKPICTKNSSHDHNGPQYID